MIVIQIQWFNAYKEIKMADIEWGYWWILDIFCKKSTVEN